MSNILLNEINPTSYGGNSAGRTLQVEDKFTIELRVEVKKILIVIGIQ